MSGALHALASASAMGSDTSQGNGSPTIRSKPQPIDTKLPVRSNNRVISPESKASDGSYDEADDSDISPTSGRFSTEEKQKLFSLIKNDNELLRAFLHQLTKRKWGGKSWMNEIAKRFNELVKNKRKHDAVRHHLKLRKNRSGPGKREEDCLMYLLRHSTSCLKKDTCSKCFQLHRLRVKLGYASCGFSECKFCDTKQPFVLDDFDAKELLNRIGKSTGTNIDAVASCFSDSPRSLGSALSPRSDTSSTAAALNNQQNQLRDTITSSSPTAASPPTTQSTLPIGNNNFQSPGNNFALVAGLLRQQMQCQQDNLNKVWAMSLGQSPQSPQSPQSIFSFSNLLASASPTNAGDSPLTPRLSPLGVDAKTMKNVLDVTSCFSPQNLEQQQQQQQKFLFPALTSPQTPMGAFFNFANPVIPSAQTSFLFSPTAAVTPMNKVDINGLSKVPILDARTPSSIQGATTKKPRLS